MGCNRGLMAPLTALPFLILIISASLSQTKAGAGPFSWGSRINFAKVAKENAPAVEDHETPQVDWEEEKSEDANYKGRFPRQTARFQPGSARRELEMLMVMREIEKSIMESISNRAAPFQGTGHRVGGADFRRAFTTLGRL